MAISSRLPGWAQIAQVYAVAVTLIYGWTIMWFFWKLPGWLNFLNSREILVILAYALGVNFVESLIALCVPIILAFALPAAWFRDVFVARGAALMLTGLGTLMTVASQFEDRDELPGLVRAVWPMLLILLGIAVLVHLAGRTSILRRPLELIADRVTVFLFATIPLSALSLLVLAARWSR